MSFNAMRKISTRLLSDLYTTHASSSNESKGSHKHRDSTTRTSCEHFIMHAVLNRQPLLLLVTSPGMKDGLLGKHMVRTPKRTWLNVGTLAWSAGP